MAWCRQAASHNLNQSWPRSLLPYGVTRPQWVKGCLHELLKLRYGWMSNHIWQNMIGVIDDPCITLNWNILPKDQNHLILTYKQLETHAWVLSNVATDALVLMYQATSIHSSDRILIFIGPVPHKLITLIGEMLENKLTFWNKIPSCLSVNGILFTMCNTSSWFVIYKDRLMSVRKLAST